MVFCLVFFLFQTETLLLRAEKRGLCDCFRAIHWNKHWDLANGHLLIFKMLFSKLQEDTECKLCPTIRKRIFYQNRYISVRLFLLCCGLSLLYVILHLLKCQKKKQCQSLAYGFYARIASCFFGISSQKLLLDSQANLLAYVNCRRSVKVSEVIF